MQKQEFDNLLSRYIAGEISPSEMEELRAFLVDENHRRAFDEAKVTWEMLGSLDSSEQEFDTNAGWEDLQHRLSKEESRTITLHAKATSGSSAWLKMAASLVLMVSLVTVFMYILPGPANHNIVLVPGKEDVEIAQVPVLDTMSVVKEDSDKTPVKVKKLVADQPVIMITVTTGDSAKLCILPDNSIVYLNVNSKLEYPSRFTGAERVVILEGEAFFDVNKNNDPFRVHCGNTVASGLGGSFNVKGYQSETQVEMMAISGSIEFAANGHSALDKMVLQPGESVKYNKSNDQLKKASVRKKDKWWEKGGLRKRLSDFFHNMFRKRKKN